MVDRTDIADADMADADISDDDNQGRDTHFMDIDRMINDGLAGGLVTKHNGLIGETSTDTMENAESVIDDQST